MSDEVLNRGADLTQPGILKSKLLERLSAENVNSGKPSSNALSSNQLEEVDKEMGALSKVEDDGQT